MKTILIINIFVIAILILFAIRYFLIYLKEKNHLSLLTSLKLALIASGLALIFGYSAYCFGEPEKQKIYPIIYLTELSGYVLYHWAMTFKISKKALLIFLLISTGLTLMSSSAFALSP